MKCEQFLDLVYEYVEATLPSEVRAAADDHLSRCEICRDAVRSEEIMAQAIARELRRTAEALTLGPEGERRVLAAWQGRPDPRLSWSVLFRSWRRWAWVAGAAACMLIAALLVGVFPPPGHNVEQVAKKPPGSQTFVSVHSSYVVPVYYFSQEDGMVTDSLEYRTNIVDLTLLAVANWRESWEN
jgi:predicted anti-sigma-YlaC factor YlaD